MSDEVNMRFGFKPDFRCGLRSGLKLQFKTKVLAEKNNVTRRSSCAVNGLIAKRAFREHVFRTRLQFNAVSARVLRTNLNFFFFLPAAACRTCCYVRAADAVMGTICKK